MTNTPSPKWRRTEAKFSDAVIRNDDWSLLDATHDRIASLFNTGEYDLTGSWRWRVRIIIRRRNARAGTEDR